METYYKMANAFSDRYLSNLKCAKERQDVGTIIDNYRFIIDRLLDNDK